MAENKEILTRNLRANISGDGLDTTQSTTKIQLKTFDDSSIVYDSASRFQPSDESFERVERMCNEKYLPNDDEEIEAMYRLFDEFRVEQTDSKLNFIDQTQLNDVEPPSTLWENTVNNETLEFHGSPIKMIGLLRPSTILEEEDSSIDSLVSFKSALGPSTSESSACKNTTKSSLNTSSGVSSSSYSSKPQSDIINSPVKQKVLYYEELGANKNNEDHLYVKYYSPSHKNSSTASSQQTENSDDNNYTEDSDDLNKGFVVDSDSGQSNLINVSHEFNDTLEEMEYIMKCGKKYFEQNGIKTTPKKPMMQPSTPKTPNTVIKNKISNLNSVIPPEYSRALQAVRNKLRYDHVVSPVGVYIKNTPKSPITTTMKTTRNIFESRKFNQKENTEPKGSQKDNKKYQHIPKKSYTSAEYKHVTDQRRPKCIPGGDKIHTYLGSSLIPAVYKHTGKVNVKTLEKKTSKTGSSLDDISIISGEVSMLVLKDANNLGKK